MNRITAARERLDHASDLPAVLDAACEAFHAIIAVLRQHQEDAPEAFPAFVIAAGAAGNGRDWIASAPSLPPDDLRAAPADAGGLMPGQPWPHVALEVADLSHRLASRLTQFADQAADPDDQASCGHAAAYARRIHGLLAGAPQP